MYIRCKVSVKTLLRRLNVLLTGTCYNVRMRRQVLVVEDNTDMREALRSFLVLNGFSVTAVDSTEDGIDAVDENDFAIALIDINLPGKSGFSMIEYIREQGYTMPLIAMTARDGLQDKLAGFELGLNDYIVKPFDLRELLARVQSQLKANTDDDMAEITTKTYQLNPASWEFYIRGKLVMLTQTEFRIMHMLLKHNRTVVKVDDLIEYAWGNDADLQRPPVRIHLANLRKKIGDYDCTIIVTIPSVGYKLTDQPV